MKGTKALKGQMQSLDMISELPEFILHHILSFLNTEEACRTSILSKTWYNAWSTMPVLGFQLQCINKEWNSELLDEEIQCYVGLIDKTLQRYSEKKHFIRKLKLEFPKVDEKFAPFIDKWLEISVRNKVQELNIHIYMPGYRLPETLFVAKSLEILRCNNAALPYYGTLKLNSLHGLYLRDVTIDDIMLQHILSSCPLINLELKFCPGLKSISLPWKRNGNIMHSDEKASTIRHFFYWAHNEYDWPWEINVGALKNLKNIEIYYAAVPDDIVSVLVSELSSLESLALLTCFMLRNIEVSSKKLKKLLIVECDDLETARIDAPNLLTFWYNGELGPSLSIVNAHVHCDSHFYLPVETLSIEWFIAVKKFLIQSNIFKVLEVNLSGCDAQIELEEDTMRQISVEPPYKLRELKLHQTCHWMASRSSLPTFMDCLFWSCRPDVLTIQTTMSFQNETIEFLLDVLRDKVKCWRHPLKGIEVEDVNFSNLVWHSELEIRFRLNW